MSIPSEHSELMAYKVFFLIKPCMYAHRKLVGNISAILASDLLTDLNK